MDGQSDFCVPLPLRCRTEPSQQFNSITARTLERSGGKSEPRTSREREKRLKESDGATEAGEEKANNYAAS